jgi:hypothetical protein
MNDMLKSARNWHKFGFVVSATAFLLLLAPFKADYSQALKEAHILSSLNLDEYQRWARGFIGQNILLPQYPEFGWAAWQEDITHFLSSHLDFKVAGKPDWDITSTIAYEHAPTNGALGDWYGWVNSSKPASYYNPDWSTARLSASRDAVGITRPPAVRHFLLRASEWHRFDGEYSFRAYMEIDEISVGGKSSSGTPNITGRWWKPLDKLNSRELFEKHSQVGLDPSKFIVEGDLGSALKTIDAKCGIRQWLESTGTWSKLTQNSESGEVILPGIRKSWSELHDRSLGDAIAFMEQKQKDIQDVSLLGLTVPGQLCVIAIPLSYLVFHLFLLLDVRAAQRCLAQQQWVGEPVAWIGVYDDLASVVVTGCSLVLMPVALSTALLLRYWQRVPSFSIQIAIVGCGGALIIGLFAVHSVGTIRKKIRFGQKASPQSDDEDEGTVDFSI